MNIEARIQELEEKRNSLIEANKDSDDEEYKSHNLWAASFLTNHINDLKKLLK